MRRAELIRKIEKAGFQFERHGGEHDIYRKGGAIIAVPRHREINEKLAKAIIRKWGL